MTYQRQKANQCLSLSHFHFLQQKLSCLYGAMVNNGNIILSDLNSHKWSRDLFLNIMTKEWQVCDWATLLHSCCYYCLHLHVTFISCSLNTLAFFICCFVFFFCFSSIALLGCLSICLVACHVCLPLTASSYSFPEFLIFRSSVSLPKANVYCFHCCHFLVPHYKLIISYSGKW